jgi:hypothetical protein
MGVSDSERLVTYTAAKISIESSIGLEQLEKVAQDERYIDYDSDGNDCVLDINFSTLNSSSFFIGLTPLSMFKGVGTNGNR